MNNDQKARMLVLWCPNWPVVAGAAAGLRVQAPAAVVHRNRVAACSAGARSAGVRRGMRRREAQSRCPELTVFGHDPDRDGRRFESVASAVESVAPAWIEVKAGTHTKRVLPREGARGPRGERSASEEEEDPRGYWRRHGSPHRISW
ncbi:hypothetical protein ACFXPA_25500 [Amycolatopsis sp. NPDC059090]|uniref:Y-family DNA polymerase n=1 Tax=unclassified Amycolatopsis TaxID=2618356 RepID=UPI00366CB2AC